MKRHFWFFIIFLGNTCLAQNVGIGITEPYNKLHVLGNLLINAPYTSTNTAPTPAQTKTMTPGNTLFYSSSDSTGRIYDPGGPNTNYGNNQTAQVLIDAHNNAKGFEIILEDVELDTGDSLIITIDGNPVLSFGNGYNTIGKWIINASLIYINFKSNNDGITGRGFTLLFKRLYENTTTQKSLSGFVGKSLFFDSKKGAFRAGGISVGSIGDYSTALGYFNTASGPYSLALGTTTKATGQSSFTAGQGTLATGLNSMAMGYTSEALGDNSFALGSLAKAQANNSIAIGGSTIASGPNSISVGFNNVAVGFSAMALGNNTQANGNYATSSGYASIATGNYSFAAGNDSKAYGLNSIAMGFSAIANGSYSTAIGYGPVSTGNFSTAVGTDANSNAENSFAIGNSVYVGGINAFGIGNNISANGAYATAMGNTTTASGNNSTAMGNSTTASGSYSTAMGNYVSTSNFSGAFAIGDNSTTTVMQSFVANGFRSRFAGGYRLLTNSAASLGVVLLPDGGSWSAISDRRLKENFLPVDAENLLKKIATLPLNTWNYTEQSKKTSRHYGPMAQDFYKAFGHDDLGEIGCDTLINQQDFLGVNLIAIQALEKRTADLKQQLEKQIHAQQQQLDALKKQNTMLLQLINDKK